MAWPAIVIRDQAKASAITTCRSSPRSGSWQAVTSTGGDASGGATFVSPSGPFSSKTQ
jgi:hypothetical protein